MVAVQGYYDGTAIRSLEKIDAKPNQRVIIAILDEFVEPAEIRKVCKKEMRGILAEYANPTLAERKKGAWERAVAEKYGSD